MNDIKRSSDESSECDAMDLDAIVAALSPEERAEYLAWCDESAEQFNRELTESEQKTL